MHSFLTPQAIAKASLIGMAIDLLGGLYLAYDLLGGKRGPLRTIARAVSYTILFFVGYAIVLGLSYAAVAATGMGILLAIEYRLAALRPPHTPARRAVVVPFGLLRGIVLGLAGATIAGWSFGVPFGIVNGVGMSLTYALGYAPSQEYVAQSAPRFSRQKVVASLMRAGVVSVAGIVGGLVNSFDSHWILFGLRFGLAAGVVSALVGFFSPTVEWWIENLPERRLGLLGLAMILVGVLLQSIQYWVVALNLALL